MPENLSSGKLASFAFCLPLALFAGIVGYQIFGPVPFGLADNNDFARVLGPLHIWPAPPFRGDPNIPFRYFVNDYVIGGPAFRSGVPTSEWLVAVLARKLARFALPPGTFQLRLMGLIHGLAFLLALAIFLLALQNRSWPLRLASGLFLVFIWTDLEYVVQLNTAYPDTVAVASLAVLFSLTIRFLLTAGGKTWKSALVFAVFAALLLGTKLQHQSALPFLAGFCVYAAWRSSSKVARTAWLLTPVLLAGVTAFMIVKTPSAYRIPPGFSIVFYKLAVLSPDSKGVLAHFQMPEQEFGQYRGRYAYESEVRIGDPALQKRILSLVTPGTLASFYWHHPDVLRQVLSFDLHESAPAVNLAFNGYGYRRETDFRRGRHPLEFTAWSQSRHLLSRLAPFHMVVFFGLVILLCGICVFKPAMALRCPVWPAALLSTLLAISSFLTASLLDALETPRHLIFFQAATDLTIFSVILAGLLALDRRAVSLSDGNIPVRAFSRVEQNNELSDRS